MSKNIPDSTKTKTPTDSDKNDIAGTNCADSIGQVKVVNGNSYFCDNQKWRKATELETNIGFCTPPKAGTIDSIIAGSDTIFYYCDTTKWRKASVLDIFGKCNKDKYYNVVGLMKERYVCRTDNLWRKMTSLEEDIGICNPQQVGKIGRSSYNVVYYCSSGGWREATTSEILGVCDSSTLYTVKYAQKEYYGCEDIPNWTKLEFPESDLGYCIPAMKDSIRIDKYSTDYICDTEWRKATQEEVLGECTDAIEDKIKWFGKKQFICNSGIWVNFTTIDNVLGACTKAKLTERGHYGRYDYVCTKLGWWTVVTNFDDDSCTAAREGEIKVYHSDNYVCRDGGWIEVTNEILVFGRCSANRENEILKYDNFNYICRDKKWIKVTGASTLYGECTTEREEEVVLYNDKNYMCHNKLWRDVSQIEAKLGLCNFDRDGKLVKLDDKTYLCSDDRWSSVTGFFAEYGKCKWDREGFSVRYEGVLYVCKSDRWITPEM